MFNIHCIGLINYSMLVRKVFFTLFDWTICIKLPVMHMYIFLTNRPWPQMTFFA